MHRFRRSWFASAKGRTQAIGTAIAAMVIATAFIPADALVVKKAPWAVGVSPIIRDGIFPWFALAVLYMEWNRPDEALAVALWLRESHPDLAFGRNLVNYIENLIAGRK